MLIVVTCDKNGGYYDHARVPARDAFGPGLRVPAIPVSPHARRSFVDHTAYEAGSIIRFITRRWQVRPAAGHRPARRGRATPRRAAHKRTERGACVE